MKTKNFNMLFYLKKVKYYESGNLLIYLCISVDEKRSEATIGRESNLKNGTKNEEKPVEILRMQGV